MKLLFDFFPILLFFIAFKVFGIYVATSVAIGASILQVAGFWLKNRRVESLHIITMILVVVLGGATLMLHNEMFIKWKPTAIYWAFALAFLVSQFIGEKPLIQRMMDGKLSLPTIIWRKVNFSWSIFFGAMGASNLFVVYNFSTNTWVNFKLFGALGLTLAFALVVGFYMAKHMENKELS